MGTLAGCLSVLSTVIGCSIEFGRVTVIVHEHTGTVKATTNECDGYIKFR